MKGLLTLKKTGKIVSFRIRGHVHNEIIIGLLVKNNTRRLYSVRDSFLMRILIGLNIPYSSICTFFRHEYYKEFTNFPYKHIFKTKGSKKFSFTPEDSAPSSR